MLPRRRKSPERPALSRPPESYRPHANTGKERAASAGLPRVTPDSTRPVTCAPTRTLRSSQEIGDSGISLKTLFNAIKTMEGRLEGKIDILASRPLINDESPNFLKLNSVSEDHKLNRKVIPTYTTMKQSSNNPER